ncbi:ribonucleotide-diphosphate reductase subunit alpha [Acinetobacter phage MD-2021a]|nr:ribonucleotide-diphosphate reductase subunit alpha [Acinetobacter phage MD-2021a]CAH1088941.1 ribonucleotide-diphosphate reductase subunit alpha [Acinetobacter phage MD-2021a]
MTKVRNFSKERKQLQKEGLCPSWMTTQGYQLLATKYLNGKSKSPKDQYERIAKTLAKHAPKEFPDFWNEIDYWKDKGWEQAFFSILWDGLLSPSTPVLTNTGTDFGLTVSCSGAYVGDSVYDFYESRMTNALLSKEGFGTSAYLGDIRPRGSKMKGGEASGAQPVAEMFVDDSKKISQGSSRRGATAWYYPIEGDDFNELVHYLETDTDGNNAGWCLTDSFFEKLKSGDKEAIKRWGKMLSCKGNVGSGYQFFVDKVNRQRPEAYVKNNLFVKASQLCSEITLFSDEDHVYTCILSSENLRMWYNRPKMLAFVATVFLDCVTEEFIQKGKNIAGIEKAIRYTEKARSLGLGAMAFHTLLLDNNIVYGSLESQILNHEIFSTIQGEAKQASQWLATIFGEPEWCVGTGMRNTHLTAIAPTKSTALILGGVSEGINPQVGFVFTQSTPAGEVFRIDPSFLNLLKTKGLYVSEDDRDTLKLLGDINNHKGSIQHRPEFSQEEKAVFRTAFEINPYDHIDLVDYRQQFVCQSQSCNLFVTNMSGKEVSKLYFYAYAKPNIASLYYHTGMRDSNIKTNFECSSCE